MSVEGKHPVQFIAMFLPQFHRDPFNDLWWGEGFTEWDNVRKAVPLFAGHSQPRVPLDGYFDLASRDELQRQSMQAKDAGIAAFSIYDYWYEGKRLLKTPIDLVRTNPDLDINYCLTWANHPWTRSWTNRSGAFDRLIEQTYARSGPERDEHYCYLAGHFSDPRYLRRAGRPVFSVYQPESLALVPGYLDGLRSYCFKELGVELEISAMLTGWKPYWGFISSYDSVTLFQAGLALSAPDDFLNERPRDPRVSMRALSARNQARLFRVWDRLPQRHKLFDYADTCRKAERQFRLSLEVLALPVHPMAPVAFDNTPRYGNRARILDGASSDLFSEHLETLAELVKTKGSGLVFLNAWNEWGEGAHLQPDSFEGGARLDAVKGVHSRMT
jgi:hypothetical protein